MNDTSVKLPAPVPAAAMPLDAMRQLAESVAKSRLFGITTPDQALTLMAIAQAEGRHPALAARDYHIINGSPSKKAEAMARDFLSAGGRIEWHRLDDEVAEATFSHPAGGSARIQWDQARVTRAGLAGGNHKRYPRQMLRSRVVSEGVRTVWPMATSGMYVPEEVAEFGPRREAEPIDVTPKQDLDTFSGLQAPGSDEDRAEAAREGARTVARRGTEAFRAWWKTITKEQRQPLYPIMEELQKLAREAAEGTPSVSKALGPPDEGREPSGSCPSSYSDAPPEPQPEADAEPARDPALF